MKPIACVSGVELLMDYLEGVLPADLRAALDEHVAACARCAAFVVSYRDTPRILRGGSAATSLPPDVETSLKAFLRARTTAFKPRE
jgi:anti-sigma factor RsiW